LNEQLTENNEKQLYYCGLLSGIVRERAAVSGRGLTYHVETFGCQMNERDSEKLRGVLDLCGLKMTDSEEADLVIYNTCTVRENANIRVFGRLGYLHSLKKKNPEMIIGLCGCMMQDPKVVEKIQKDYKFVDLIFGTHNIYRLAELLYRRLSEGNAVSEILDAPDIFPEGLPVQRTYPFKSGVNIMYGCDNFCSYCIVPYVRGRERSRTAADIISEVTNLALDGVKEVMLLGQNVNSYGRKEEGFPDFADLLKMTAKVDGIERIRFMTSHPKDLSDLLIETIATEEKVCKHIHLPLQSGSSRILKAMNRRYDSETYFELTQKIRRAVPQISITTDIIVGFPGETEEDFQETLNMVKRVRFDSAFTFIYSKRNGTPAAAMEDQVPEEVVKDRFDRLLASVQEIARNECARFTGSVGKVLVESVNRQDETLVTGRLDNNMVVHFPGTADMIGNICEVELTACRGFYFYGKRIERR